MYLYIVKQKKEVMDYSESRVCSLCGSPISDNNPDGLGYECRKAIEKAKFKALFLIDNNSLYYNHVIEVEIAKKHFVELFSKTKFRSDFNKSFYNSIKNSDRISKKQLFIMKDKIFQKNPSISESIFYEVKAAKESFLKEKVKSVVLTREQIEVARREIRMK